ncbi:MAG: AMP-binding protein [Rhodospirillales bacterium]
MLDNSPIRMPADGRAPSSAEALRHWAEHAPDKIAFRLLSGEDIAHEINYGALYKRAENVAGALSQKANPGDRVMLLFAQGLDFVVGFVACQMAGMIPVPMSLPRGRERNSRLAHVEADCLPAVILSHEAARKALAGRTFSVPVIEISKMENGTPQASTRNNDIAFLQYTSGSTGTPKGVIISQDNLWSNVADISASFRVKQQSETVTWLPSYHDMGLVGTILVPLFQGVTSNLMAPDDFIRRPLSWLNAISRFRADIAGGPNFALELCANRLQNTEQAPWVGDLDLSTWQVLFVGAEPVNAETLARFSAAAAPYGFNPASFLPCYGLAEATLYAAGSRGTPGQLTQRFDTSALQNGRAVPANDSPRNKKADTPRLPPTSLVGCGGKNLQRSTQVVIADPDTRTPLNDRLLGEVWLSGPGISKGYWPNSQDDGKFQARIEGMPETAFLRTGDIGFIDDGNLYITGRISDLIIVNGVNYFPPDLENSTAAADDRLPKWRAAAFSYEVNGHPKVVAIQEIPRLGRHDLKMSELVSRIRQSVFDDHGLTLDDVVLLKPGGIPVTASGKVQRRRCRDLYLAHELENLAWPSGSGTPLPKKNPGDEDAMIGQTPVTEALRTALASVLNLTLADIDISKRMNEFPLDSLRIVEVQAFLESRHGMIISAEALQSETPLNLISSSRGNSPAADPAVYWRDAALDTVLSSECLIEPCEAVHPDRKLRALATQNGWRIDQTS